MGSLSDKKYLEEWSRFSENIKRATPIDLDETPLEKKRRIERLEKDDEAWFKYYCPTFYTSEPAPFQKKSTKQVMSTEELYLVRSWARELAKSARTMMETLKKILTKRKKNLLMVSDSFANASRLLLPYKVMLESNNRIINDYGIQQSLGNWEAHEFKTRSGASFRALGAGQSPRGTRNDAARPDIILIDDIDTDQDCRNTDIIDDKIKWIEEALIPTRSISEPLMIIACGNIIAEYCCITEMAKKADRHEIVNIRDEHGNSTWPTKNTEEMIDRVLSLISFDSQQKEYFNNPMKRGKTFTAVKYIRPPALRTCEMVVIYADPSTSNKDKPRIRGRAQQSFKSVQVIGFKNHRYYVYWIRLDQVGNKAFVDWLYQAHEFCKRKGVDPIIQYIENNSLQAPHYEQVIQPAIKMKADEDCIAILPIREDTRNKPDKYERIEGTLQPIDSRGDLLFDEELKDTPDMEVMEKQMLSVSPNQKLMDGPDCLEGGVWIIQNRKVVHSGSTYRMGSRADRKY